MHHFKAMGESKPKLQSGNAQFVSKSAIFCPVWPSNLMDDLGKQQGTSSILHQALCSISKPCVNSNWSCSRKRSIRVKTSNCLSRVTLKFDRWHWKTIGYLFYVATSFVHHLIAISEFKLKFTPETPNLNQNWRHFEPCDFEIWQMTLKNNRAPLLCYFKLCASFHSHWRIQTGATVRKFRSKSTIFLAVWPWNLMDDLEKQ